MIDVTLEDIASKAEVSVSTVSRAFRRPEAVSRGTRERILATATALGYAPSHGRARQATTLAIGFAVPDIANPVVIPMIKAAQHEARRAGFALMLSDADEIPEDEATAIEQLVAHVDGLILGSPRLDDDIIRSLAARRPTVLVNRAVPGVASVNFDEAGIDQAVEHFAALGHTSIHYLAGPSTSYSERVRRLVVRRASEIHGIECIVTGPSQPTFDAGVRLADIVLSRKSTAVLAFNDLIALGVMSALRTRNVDIPREISVIGIDDIWLDNVSVPALTTVHFPWQNAGTAAVQRLLRLRDGAAADQVDMRALPTELLVRSSTAEVQHAH